jgi:hypothetical protein
MFTGITTSAILDSATTWAAELGPILLIVVGFGVAVFIANWVARKFGRG